MGNLSHDFRFAVRLLRRSPAFTSTAVVTLAVGIGLATAVFTVANAVLFRRLGVRDQQRLVVLNGESANHKFANIPLTPRTVREFARGSKTLQSTAVFGYYGAGAAAVRDGDEITQMQLARVSGDFFSVLGTPPLLGRAFRKTDDVEGAAPVAVISNLAWHDRFGGDPRVIGRQIEMYQNGQRYTIVGVMPDELDFPKGTELWAPLTVASGPGSDSTAEVDVIARLANGATPASVAAELTAFNSRAASPWQRSVHGVATTLPQLLLGDVRPAVLIFIAAALLLLLITCINVANLLLVRGVARAREVAVRSAIGAVRWRIVMLLFAENTLLALVGGALGIVVALGAVQAFVAFAPADLPRLHEIRVDYAAFAAALGITAVAVFAFGFAPAVMSSQAELQRELRAGSRQSPPRRYRVITEALVIGQVALALIVLSAAGLIVTTLRALEHTDLSLDPSHVVVVELTMRERAYDTEAKQAAMLDRLMRAIEQIPGVQGASPVVAAPFAGTAWAGRPAADGQSAEQAAQNPMLNMEVVEPGYFAALAIPVRRGRAFNSYDREGAEPVVMLSETAARSYWPSENPLGKHLRMGGDLAQRMTVVGIVPDTRYRDLREGKPTVYFPLEQSIFPFAPGDLVVRSTATTAAIVARLRSVIAETAPGVTIARAAPFQSFLNKPIAQPRLNALLLSVFAIAAVVLAAVGLVGVMSAMLRQRTRELGVRMALGATARNVQWMMLRRGLVLGGAGTAIGLMAAVAVNRLLTDLLYHVQPVNLPTLGGAALFILAVVTFASMVPAYASTRIDPVTALRAD